VRLYDLLATGPFNSPKDAIQPLTGIIETDWSPFTFTMNWKFTRKRAPIAFERDEPFCMVFPMPRGLVEAVEPEFRSMDEEPAVQDAYRTWSESRQAFNEGLKVPGSEAQAQKWQKDYFRGSGRFGAPPEDLNALDARIWPIGASSNNWIEVPGGGGWAVRIQSPPREKLATRDTCRMLPLRHARIVPLGEKIRGWRRISFEAAMGTPKVSVLSFGLPAKTL